MLLAPWIGSTPTPGQQASLAEIANREKELQEREAASPLGILTAQARRAQALDKMVNQDVSRPDGDRPQL